MSLRGSVLGPLYTGCGCLAWGLCGTPNSRSEGASTSVACAQDPFPLTGLPRPALTRGFVPSLISSLLLLCSSDIPVRPALS